MYLKSLTLKGFKSFAETTKIQLSPGVTVVVGPNGSGKSNIVDSIVWVLGAQGPRSLRSQKMEDVIFAGSNNRTGLGRAEVTLVIDNSDQLLPIPAAEIALTRSLTRAGESDYSINGTPARLVELVELLADAHMGRSQHVIIGQGQIDQMLSARPEERRAVIEEAAGVHKFRRRKERANRRLAGSDGDVERASDVLREVRRQVKPIERQAEAFLRHQELTRRLEELRAYLAGVTLNRLKLQFEEAKREGSELSVSVERIRQETRSIEAEKILPIPPVTTLDVELAGRQIDELKMRHAVVDAKLSERIRSIKARLSDLTLSSELDRSRDRTTRAKDELRQVIEAAELLFKDQASFSADEDEVRSLEVDPMLLEGLRREHRELLQRSSNGAALLSGQRAALVERRRYLGDLQDRVGRLQRDIDASQLAHAQLVLEEANEPVQLDGAQLERLSEELAQVEAHLVSVRSELSDANAAFAAETARVQALEAVLGEQRRQINLDSVSTLGGVIGGIFELVGAQSGYEKALEATLGPLSAAIVTSSVNSAMEMIPLLETKGSSLVALFPSEQESSESVEGDLANALPGKPLGAQLIFADPRAKRAILAHCRNVRVVETLEEAIAAVATSPGFRFVTKRGELVSHQSLILPGSQVTLPLSELLESKARAESAHGTLERSAAERVELEARFASLRSLVAAETEEMTRRVSDHQKRVGRIDEVESSLRRLERELSEVTDAYFSAEADVVDRQGRLDVIEVEAQEVSLQLQEVGARLSTMELRLAEFERRRRAIDTLKSEFRSKAATLEERKRAAERRVAESMQAEAEVSSLLSSQSNERAELVDELAGLESRLALSHSILGRLGAVTERQNRLASVIADRLNERYAQERRIAETKARLSQELAEAVDRMHQVELLVTESRTVYASSLERYIRDLSMTESQLLTAPLPPASSALSAVEQQNQVEAELEKIGLVNPHAAAELEEAQIRISFLEGQLDDIRASRKELAKVASQIDREMRSVFMVALEDVGRSFKTIFSELFPGGSASIVLLDPENPLESGIDFELFIPSKKVRRMSLLSGGERSMVALAFLFAVFQSRPAPFVILDEVEAALDDKNLARFLGLLEHFRSSAQLLVISHQKRTMEVADVLLGATMDISGTTKVVREEISQRLPLTSRASVEISG